MEEIPSFGIERENEERRDGGCTIVYDPHTRMFAVGQKKEGYLLLFGGGFDPRFDPKEEALRELKEESGLFDFAEVVKVGEAFAHYWNMVKKIARVAHTSCYLVILTSSKTQERALEEHEDFDLAYVTKEKLLANWREHNTEHDLDHWLYYLEKALEMLAERGYEV